MGNREAPQPPKGEFFTRTGPLTLSLMAGRLPKVELFINILPSYFLTYNIEPTTYNRILATDNRHLENS